MQQFAKPKIQATLIISQSEATKTTSNSTMLSVSHPIALSLLAIVFFILLQTATLAQLIDGKGDVIKQNRILIGASQSPDDATSVTKSSSDLTTSIQSKDGSATDMIVSQDATSPAIDISKTGTTSGKKQAISRFEDNVEISKMANDDTSDGKTSTSSYDNDGEDDMNNATLVIDYNQQGYYLATIRPEVSITGLSAKSTKRASTQRPTATTPFSRLSSSSVEADEMKVSLSESHHIQLTSRPALPTQLSSIEPVTSDRLVSNALTSHRLKTVVDSVNHEPRPGLVARNAPVLGSSARNELDSGYQARQTDNLNETNLIQMLLKKKPYSKFWSVEKKWDDIFKRFLAAQEIATQMLAKSFMRDIESYADVSISHQCAEDLRYIREHSKQSRNMKWLMHMLDSAGKTEPGMLTGNLANLGHVIQCVRVRAPIIASNETFNERFFDQQTAKLGERFRGKYCLASIRPVLPERPKLVSRFSQILNASLLSNISYLGEPLASLKQRTKQFTVPKWAHDSIDHEYNRLDQVPFESELFEFLIFQRNFMYSLPRMTGVCYPSSCSRDDIRSSLQKLIDDQHQVVDIEFDCEQEEMDAWSWFSTPRLVVYVLLAILVAIVFMASLIRFVLVDRMNLKKKLSQNSRCAQILAVLDNLSMDKTAGILFVKIKTAQIFVDETKVENQRSTAIDSLKGFMILVLVYSELAHLGCLPLPFMWLKWGDAMFPFFRSFITQIFLNTSIWTEAFYIMSAYLIATKLLENFRPKLSKSSGSTRKPRFLAYLNRRYIRLLMPMLAFISLNYVWPRLSNGWVMQDQANKIMASCDKHGWTNILMFHNYNSMNETCLWPTHVSASFFQLHILSYPILLLLLYSLRTQVEAYGTREIIHKLLRYSGFFLIISLAIFGLLYPAYQASKQELIVPFLVDYIDYDNYQRVIEWTILPTYNHLTSYMIGLLLAYFVVEKRAKQERLHASDPFLHLGGSSFESVVSSSTQELNFKQKYRNPAEKVVSSRSDQVSSSNCGSIGKSQSANSSMPISTVLGSCLVGLIMLISLTTSWFWNGLGQPMDTSQTFWYMIGTKLLFNISFTYLFYKYFATRRNSSNPWMLTRFLVPIGRMSLTLFYISWLVIWFDLLTSLNQWHPSHYFVIEKFNEIIFVALILSLFIYGGFEGSTKILQYSKRVRRLRKLPAGAAIRHTDYHSFDYFFEPMTGEENYDMASGLFCKPENQYYNEFSNSKQTMENKLVNALSNKSSIDSNPNDGLTGTQIDSRARIGLEQSVGEKAGSSGGSKRHLSIVDQYKLNAELRANYSFASIGLYESVGATDDLNNSSGDPQSLSTPENQRRP